MKLKFLAALALSAVGNLHIGEGGIELRVGGQVGG